MLKFCNTEIIKPIHLVGAQIEDLPEDKDQAMESMSIAFHPNLAPEVQGGFCVVVAFHDIAARHSFDVMGMSQQDSERQVALERTKYIKAIYPDQSNQPLPPRGLKPRKRGNPKRLH
jgi:hypothetical protein